MSMKLTGVIDKVKTKLITGFSIIKIGLISFYLGFKIDRDEEQKTIKLFQSA